MGKKKVVGEDGKTYTMKEKKPFYKKVWFWVLAVIVVIIAASSLNGGSDKDSAAANNTQTESKDSVTNETAATETESTEPTDEFHSIGDTVTVGDVTYTLNSVELTDERNEFEENQPANVVKVTYTVKNDSDSDIPVGTDSEVYGSDDKKAETYANENTMGSVAPGKQMDVVAHFGLNQTGEIEIHFAPMISFEDAAIFKATV